MYIISRGVSLVLVEQSEFGHNILLNRGNVGSCFVYSLITWVNVSAVLPEPVLLTHIFESVIVSSSFPHFLQ